MQNHRQTKRRVKFSWQSPSQQWVDRCRKWRYGGKNIRRRLKPNKMAVSPPIYSDTGVVSVAREFPRRYRDPVGSRHQAAKTHPTLTMQSIKKKYKKTWGKMDKNMDIWVQAYDLLEHRNYLALTHSFTWFLRLEAFLLFSLPDSPLPVLSLYPLSFLS